jgi:hypothetical protein
MSKYTHEPTEKRSEEPQDNQELKEHKHEQHGTLQAGITLLTKLFLHQYELLSFLSQTLKRN